MFEDSGYLLQHPLLHRISKRLRDSCFVRNLLRVEFYFDERLKGFRCRFTVGGCFVNRFVPSREETLEIFGEDLIQEIRSFPYDIKVRFNSSDSRQTIWVFFKEHSFERCEEDVFKPEGPVKVKILDDYLFYETKPWWKKVFPALPWR